MRLLTARTLWSNPVWYLARIATNVVYLADPHIPPIGRIFIPPTWLRFFLSISGIVWAIIAFAATSPDEPPTTRAERRSRAQRRAAKPSVLTTGLTNLAVLLAGRRRAHIRDAWLSDLDRPRDPAGEGTPGISGWRKVIYAAGHQGRAPLSHR